MKESVKNAAGVAGILGVGAAAGIGIKAGICKVVDLIKKRKVKKAEEEPSEK